jgi:putative tricarboxylic transport membrane protein
VRTRLKSLDGVSGLFLLLFGLFMAYESLKLPIGGFRHPDAGVLPFGISVLMIILSAVVLIGPFRKAELREWIQSGEGRWKVWIALAAMLVYVPALSYLGFVLSTFLVMVLLMKGLEKARWTTALYISIPSVLLTYFLFTRWLGVPLPKGIIPV